MYTRSIYHDGDLIYTEVRGGTLDKLRRYELAPVNVGDVWMVSLRDIISSTGFSEVILKGPNDRLIVDDEPRQCQVVPTTTLARWECGHELTSGGNCPPGSNGTGPCPYCEIADLKAQLSALRQWVSEL